MKKYFISKTEQQYHFMVCTYAALHSYAHTEYPVGIWMCICTIVKYFGDCTVYVTKRYDVDVIKIRLEKYDFGRSI